MQSRGSKILASILISVLLVSSLYTSNFSSYQQSSRITPSSSFPLAFADDNERNGRHYDDRDDSKNKDKKVKLLIKKYRSLVDELDRIGNISDEAIMIDYLTDAIKDLKDDIKNLIKDKDAKKDLLKILDQTLKRTEKAREEALDLKEDSTNKELHKAKYSIRSFIDEVRKLKYEHDIPSKTADSLIRKATMIYTNSQKTDLDIVSLTQDVEQTTGNSLVGAAKVKVSKARQIVDGLQALDVIVTLIAERHSPTEASISFFVLDSSTEFKIIIPYGALATLTIIGLIEESTAYATVQIPFPIEVPPTMFPVIIDINEQMANIEDEPLSIKHRLSLICIAVTPSDNCRDKNKLGIDDIRSNPDIFEDLGITEWFVYIDPVIGDYPEIEKLFKDLERRVQVSGFKFEDDNKSLSLENVENGLAGWKFILRHLLVQSDTVEEVESPIFLDGRDLTTMSVQSGEFIFPPITIPYFAKIVVIEDLTEDQKIHGWENTVNLRREYDVPPTAPGTTTPLTTDDIGNRQRAHLGINVQVINDNNGESLPNNFTISVNGAFVDTPPFQGSVQERSVTLKPGPFGLGVDGPTIESYVVRIVLADDHDAECPDFIDGGEINTVRCEIILNDKHMPTNVCSIPSGLLGWWKGDGNALDYTGHIHGTLQNGATFASGKVDQAFSFDGVDDFVSLGGVTIDDADTPFSISAWMKSDRNTAGMIVGQGQTQSGTNHGKFMAQIYGNSDSTLRFEIGATQAWSHQITTNLPVVVADEWLYVVMTYDGMRDPNGIKFYIDGHEADVTHGGSSGFPGFGVDPRDEWYIGAQAGRTGQVGFFDGLIDEVQIYNRVLTPEEIQSKYAAGSAGVCEYIPPPPPPATETTCGDGIDNDVDGTTDMADSDCSSPPSDIPSVDVGNGYFAIAGSSCETGATTRAVGVDRLFVGPRLFDSNISATGCYRAWATWDISAIPDTATITNVAISFTKLPKSHPLHEGNVNALIYSLENVPEMVSDDVLRADIRQGTLYVAGDPNFSVNGDHVTNLGPLAREDLANRLNSGAGWFGIGLSADNESTSNWNLAEISKNIDLIITYSP